MGFLCHICGKLFGENRNLLRHIRAVHDKHLHECATCSASFSRSDALKRHVCKGTTSIHKCQVSYILVILELHLLILATSYKSKFMVRY